MLKVKTLGGFGGYPGGLKQFATDNQLRAKHFSASPLQHGVLYIDGKYDKDVKHQRAEFAYDIATKAYNGGAKNVCVLTTMNIQSRNVVRRALIGDYAHVVDFLKERHMSNKKHLPVFYTHWMGGYASDRTPVKCFLDIEWYGEDDEETAARSVLKTIRKVQDALPKDAGVAMYSVIGGQRSTARGNKWSFHVTFLEYIFETMAQHRDFVVRVLHEETFDRSVYKKNGLMRVPWSPKDTSANSDAILYPMFLTSSGITKGEPLFDADIFEAMDIIPRDNLSAYKRIQCESGRVRPRVVRPIRDAAVAAPVVMDERDVDMLDFWNKLHHYLISAIQRHRHRKMQQVAAFNRDVGVPLDPVNFSSFTCTSKPGIFQVRVRGDTFCEYDHPNYGHSSSDDKICLSINFNFGTYNQLCYACNPSSRDIKYYSLFDGIGINIKKQNLSASRTLQVAGKYGAVLLLHTIANDIIYSPRFGAIPYMFDHKKKIWKTNAEATNLLLGHKNDFRQKYQRYLREAELDRTNKMIADTSKEKSREVLRDTFIKFCQTDPFSLTAACSIIEACVSNFETLNKTCPQSMDINDHIVPLNDDTCFNVITGESITRTQDMFCTSYVNARLKQSEDDECQRIRAWFLEVSRGRPDLAEYMIRLSGYFMTMETYDRHFYVPNGIGRNGKGVWAKLLKV